MLKRNLIILICLMTMQGGWQLQGQVPLNGLVAWYSLNHNVLDVSGNGNSGSNTGGTFGPDRCLYPLSALYLNGAYQYVNLPPSKFELNAYSYSVWIKVDAFPPSSIDGWMIFSAGSAYTGYCQALSIHPDGGILGTSYNQGTNPVGSWTKTAPIQTSKWYHIVYTRDDNMLNIYINGLHMPNVGQPLYTEFTNGQAASYGSDDVTAIIGCRSNMNPNNFFKGAIDELLVYDRVLTQEEILQLYQTKCMIAAVNGMDTVCQGQKNINYRVYAESDSTQFAWSYSGTGVTINGSADSVLLDFSNQATAGTLSVNVNGGYYSNQTVQLPITVRPLPGKPEINAGPAEVCYGQNGVEYSASAAGNPTDYTWKFSGTGATIIGTANDVFINFSDHATGGALSLTSTNNCGTSEPSNELNILVKDCTPALHGLVIPNAFTPNGDNLNDVFYIQDLPANSKVLIFNRNGQLVYQSDNYGNDWDGKDKDGKILESGTYWYIITLPGFPTEFKGFVFLKR